MSNINDSAIVKQQYASANNLSTRISIHDKYSTNKMGFGNWIVSNYKIEKGMKVLELGCGTGDMWKGRETLVSACSKLILSDFSDGMVATTKETVGNYDNIEYRVLDIQEIPYENESFDIIIANTYVFLVAFSGDWNLFDRITVNGQNRWSLKEITKKNLESRALRVDLLADSEYSILNKKDPQGSFLLR